MKKHALSPEKRLHTDLVQAVKSYAGALRRVQNAKLREQKKRELITKVEKLK